MSASQQSFLVAGQPVAGYRTITADNPWRYDDIGIRGAAEHHYDTMSVEEICELPIGPLGAENSHLYLWVTNSFIEDGFDVMRAWGYRYITAITWVKDKIGCGHYFRNTTEHMLFGVRGSLPLKVANLPTHFEAPRTKHSRKPERSFEIVEEASHGPYLELFARGEMRHGWTGWGNQAAGNTIQIPEVGATAHRQGGASLGDVPTTERLSRYCPHGDRGMQNAPEEAAQPRYRGAAPPRVKAEGVTGGRDPQLFGSNEQPQQRGENA